MYIGTHTGKAPPVRHVRSIKTLACASVLSSVQAGKATQVTLSTLVCELWGKRYQFKLLSIIDGKLIFVWNVYLSLHELLGDAK